MCVCVCMRSRSWKVTRDHRSVRDQIWPSTKRPAPCLRAIVSQRQMATSSSPPATVFICGNNYQGRAQARRSKHGRARPSFRFRGDADNARSSIRTGSHRLQQLVTDWTERCNLCQSYSPGAPGKSRPQWRP